MQDTVVQAATCKLQQCAAASSISTKQIQYKVAQTYQVLGSPKVEVGVKLVNYRLIPHYSKQSNEESHSTDEC
jgi:hypothetical protein